MNNSAWLSTNMKSLDKGALTDPDGTGQKPAVAASSAMFMPIR